MNQQQLQIARTALWRQTAAPVVTLDDAAAWLDAMGLCLFLPRPAQLPAPAPSLVEACLGGPALTPSPAAITLAMELTARLIDAHRAIPLNLLGTFSEQPDFLVTPEVLPWVAAVRGDRQWKTAPPPRTAPIVLRSWEALEHKGEATAVEIREVLGRELTEAAVLRALIELWTSLRAAPIYTPGEPTRWSLLRRRFPAELATASNTSQTTALSALLSIYLRGAVAATAEEAEIFLSPLTARSRIREVVHGMTATRQFGTMALGVQTLLYIEGSLPEFAATPEPEAAPAVPEKPAFHPPFRKEPGRGPRREPWKQRQQGPRTGPGGPRRESRPPAFRRDQERPAAAPGSRKLPDTEGAAPETRRFGPGSGSRSGPRSGSRPPFDDRRKGQGSDRGSFQKRSGRPPFRSPAREQRGDRVPRPNAGPPQAPGSAESADRGPRERPATGKPWTGPRQDRGQSRAPGRGQDRGKPKPWQKRTTGGFGGRGRGPASDRPSSEKRTWGEKRVPRKGPGEESGRTEERPRREPRFTRGDRPVKPSKSFGPAGKGRPPRAGAPRTGRPFGSKTARGKPGFSKPKFGKPGFGKPAFGKAKRPGDRGPGSARPASGRQGSGRSGSGPSAGRPARAPGQGFRKPGKPSERNPGKNRNQEDKPE